MKRVFDSRWNLHIYDNNDMSHSISYMCTNIFKIQNNVINWEYSNNKTHLIIQEKKVLRIISLEQKSYIAHEFNPRNVLPLLSHNYQIHDFYFNKSNDIFIIQFTLDLYIYIIYFDSPIVYSDAQVISITRFKNDNYCKISLNHDDKIITMTSNQYDKIQYRYIKSYQSIFREVSLASTEHTQLILRHQSSKTYFFQLICNHTNEITIIDILKNKTITLVTIDPIFDLTFYYSNDNFCYYIITIENNQIKHYKFDQIVDGIVLHIIPFLICDCQLLSNYTIISHYFKKIQNNIYYIIESTFIDHNGKMLTFIDIYTGNIVYHNYHNYSFKKIIDDTYCLWNDNTWIMTEMTLVNTNSNATKTIYAKPNVICRNLSFDQSLMVDLLEA